MGFLIFFCVFEHQVFIHFNFINIYSLSNLSSNSSEVAEFLELMFSEDLVNIFSDIFPASLNAVTNSFLVELDPVSSSSVGFAEFSGHSEDVLVLDF